MDRSALARELFDLHQRLRNQVQALMLDERRSTRDIGVAIRGLVERADKIVEGYCASADSGATRVTVND